MFNEAFIDPHGKPSSMRLMSFIALVIAGVLAFVSLSAAVTTDPQTILYFLLAAFAPKTAQRFAEKEKEKNEYDTYSY